MAEDSVMEKLKKSMKHCKYIVEIEIESLDILPTNGEIGATILALLPQTRYGTVWVKDFTVKKADTVKKSDT